MGILKKIISPWRLSFLLLICGLLMSYFRVFQDQNWFARSGSLVVAIGILTALQRIYSSEIMNGIGAFTKALGQWKIEKKHKNEGRQKELIDKHYARIDKIIQDYNKKKARAFGKKEAFLLITGTIVWGFGDLIRYVFSE